MKKVILAVACWIVSSLSFGQEQLFSPGDFVRYRLGDAPDRARVTRGIEVLSSVSRRMESVSNVSPRLLVADSRNINAFATNRDGFPVVIFTRGILTMLAGDEDAMAFVYGHELGHHDAAHLRNSAVFSSILDVIGRTVIQAIDERYKTKLAGIVIGRLAVELAQQGANRTYSRAQELEADEIGLQWMVKAGFDPAGAMRLQSALAQAAGDRASTLFSTHPSYAERTETLERRSRELAGKLGKGQAVASKVSAKGTVTIGGASIGAETLARAANADSADAWLVLALTNFDDNASRGGTSGALRPLDQAVRLGSGDARIVKAMLVRAGVDKATTIEVAMRTLREGSGSGNPLARFATSAIDSTSPDPLVVKATIRSLQDMFDGSCVFCGALVASALLRNPQLVDDFGSPVHPLKAAAERGSLSAQVLLGLMLSFGGPVIPRDFEQAYRYLKMAAERKVPLAQLAIGVMKWEAKGSSRDENEALTYLNAAAASGSRAAGIYLESLDAYRSGDQKTFEEIRARALTAFREVAESEVSALGRNEAAAVVNAMIQQMTVAAIGRIEKAVGK